MVDQPSNQLHDAAASSLLPLDLYMKTVDCDCHCLFKAVMACMVTSCLSHWDVRKQIVDYVMTHWDDQENQFSKIVRMDNEKETPLSYQERMLGGRKDWGGYPEVMAAARVFGTHIVLFHYVQGDETLQSTFVSAPNLDFADPPTIHLVRVQDKQYHAALRVGKIPSREHDEDTLPHYPPPPGSPFIDSSRDDAERLRLASLFAHLPGSSSGKHVESGNAIARDKERPIASRNTQGRLKTRYETKIRSCDVRGTSTKNMRCRRRRFR
jgi:hypothetical protein